MTLLLVQLLVAYLLGSISGSLLLGRFRGIDIRNLGSGNAGGTNALRTQGWRFALGVVAIDIGKGALAAGLAWLPIGASALAPRDAALACGLAAVLGHVWPVFFGFRGGKGAATLVGALAVAWPLALAVLLPLWAIVLVATGYVGLATVIAGVALIPTALGARGWSDGVLLAFAAAAVLLIAWTHRGNLARLASGTESRFERARLFHRQRHPG